MHATVFIVLLHPSLLNYHHQQIPAIKQTKIQPQRSVWITDIIEEEAPHNDSVSMICLSPGTRNSLNSRASQHILVDPKYALRNCLQSHSWTNALSIQCICLIMHKVGLVWFINIITIFIFWSFSILINNWHLYLFIIFILQIC